MNRKTRIWAAATAALLATALVGCSGDKDVSNGEGSANLKPVTVKLDDGRSVDCVALIGYKKGGLSCDWESAR